MRDDGGSSPDIDITRRDLGLAYGESAPSLWKAPNVDGTWAERYARHWSPVIRPMGQRLVGQLPIAKADCVLDLGTGDGQLLPDLAEAAPEAVVAAVDRNQDLLAIAAGRIIARVACMEAPHLGFASGTFDAAVAAFVLFQMPEPDKALTEIARVMRQGGLLGTATWGGGGWLPGGAIWDDELDAAGIAVGTPPAKGFEDLVDTPAKMEALLEGAGFRTVRVWIERFERAYRLDELVTIRLAMDERLRSLEAKARRAITQRVRDRLSASGPDELTYQPDVVYAVARR